MPGVVQIQVVGDLLLATEAARQPPVTGDLPLCVVQFVVVLIRRSQVSHLYVVSTNGHLAATSHTHERVLAALHTPTTVTQSVSLTSCGERPG